MLEFKDKIGERIILRPWTDDDVESLIEISKGVWMIDNLKNNYSSPMTTDEAKEFIDYRKENTDKKIAFAIELDGKAIGNICVFAQEGIYSKSAELTFWLNDNYWNRGIMTNAVKTIVQYAFSIMPVVRIYSEPYSRNIGSKIVLRRSGFKCDGVLRSCVMKNGMISDISVFSILSTEVGSIK